MKHPKLDELEQRAAALRPKPSRVQYELAGEEYTGSFDEMLKAGGRFMRFCDNSSSMRDVLRLLLLWDEAAAAVAENDSACATGPGPDR